MIGTDLEAATNRARATIRECDNLIVALSGGVDSAVLLALAVEVLGTDRVLAVTGRSGSLAADDLESARTVARALGARHQVIETRELESQEYRENAGDRCFHCRTELFEVLGRLARRLGFRAIAYCGRWAHPYRGHGAVEYRITPKALGYSSASQHLDRRRANVV